MVHKNAALTPRHRLKVARLVVEAGWPISEVAARFQVSWPTVKRWVDRYLAGESMEDRSSRPKTSPNKTGQSVTKRCVSLRMRLGEGPVQLASRLGIAPSTAHRILTTARLNRLSYVDRATGEPIRRYEHPHPGSLVHVDVKKIGNIPDGGGWRYVGDVAELLDVDVQHRTRMVVLVASDGLPGGAVDVRQPVQVRVGQEPVDRGWRDPQPTRELHRSLAQAQPELDAALGRGLVGLGGRAVRAGGAVLHGLASPVAVGPAFHGGPGDLKAGGDLADRPALVDHELADDQAVAWCEGGIGV